jgi:peptide/nickel transport system permease protein
MVRFAARRFVQMVLVLVAISIITFVIFNVIPGGGSEGAVVRIAGRASTEATRAQVRKDFGFDKPLYVQYWRLMEKTVDGDLQSYSNRENVREQIIERIPRTASLVIGAAVMWVVVGFAFGTLMALHQGRLLDRLLTGASMVGISMPIFWLGLLLLYYLTYKLPLFPAGGYSGLTQNPLQWAYHLILPWSALSVLYIGFYSRLLRSNVLDIVHEDYVRTARAKGLSERRVLVRHVLRNALIPIVALFGLDFGALIGGAAIITETVFNIDGVGGYVAQSIGGLDLPPILGTTLYGAFFIVLFSALVDVAYAFLDPRIRLRT